jgi:hypothetical protein
MGKIRTAGLCLACALALSAIVAASASASLPEWGGCEPTPRGAYTDAACTHKAADRKSSEGKYEWYTGAEFGRVAEEAKGEQPYGMKEYNIATEFGPSTFETSSGKTMTCTGGEGSVQLENHETETIGGKELYEENPETEEEELVGYTPAYTIHGSTKGVKQILLRFTGCESEGQHCKSKKAKQEGEVSNEGAWVFETNEDPVGKLGFIDKEKGEVGLSLTAIVKTKKTEQQELLAAICLGPVGTINIGGETKGGNSIISLIGPVDQMRTEFTDTYSQGAPGEQVPSAFEGGREDTLRAFLSNENVWEPIALSTTNTLHVKGPPIEIKTEP